MQTENTRRLWIYSDKMSTAKFNELSSELCIYFVPSPFVVAPRLITFIRFKLFVRVKSFGLVSQGKELTQYLSLLTKLK